MTAQARAKPVDLLPIVLRKLFSLFFVFPLTAIKCSHMTITMQAQLNDELMETSFQNGQAAQPHQEGGDWFTQGAGFRVIWRNGGTKRFRWQRVLKGFASREEAQAKADSIIKMGYHAEVREPSSLRHGLPESWDSKTQASDFRETAGGWMVPA